MQTCRVQSIIANQSHHSTVGLFAQSNGSNAEKKVIMLTRQGSDNAAPGTLALAPCAVRWSDAFGFVSAFSQLLMIV
jgi:hypothetical protein